MFDARNTLATAAVWISVLGSCSSNTLPKTCDTTGENGPQCPAGEVCIGNTVCRKICQSSIDCPLTQACIDSYCQPYGQECGNDPDACHPDYTCDGALCIRSQCGDGYAAPGEACDEGKRDTADCNYAAGQRGLACTSQRCGDGYTNQAGGERCDEGTADTSNCNYAGGTGAEACTKTRCGDGYFNAAANEACDEGNQDTPSCNYAGGQPGIACTVPRCGDRYINAAADEDCDEGPADTPNCNYADGQPGIACTVPRCGDGYFNAAAEVCDDGGDSPQCDGDCTPVECGDLYVNIVQEECDGGRTDTAECDADCTLAVCGDAAINAVATEECDDGNTTEGDGCSRECWYEMLFDDFRPLNADAAGDAFDDGTVQIASNGSTWIALWKRKVWNHQEIVFARSANGVFWSPPQGLPSSNGTARDILSNVSLVWTGDSRWLATWTYRRFMGASELLVTRSDDDGQTWRSPVDAASLPASTTTAIGNTQLVVLSGDAQLLLWSTTSSGNSDSRVFLSYSPNRGQTWLPPQNLGEAAVGLERYIRAAVDPAGTAFAVWKSEAGLRLITSEDGINISAPRPLATGTPASIMGRIDVAADEAGRWYVVWDGRLSPNEPTQILLVTSDDRGDTWSPAQVVGPKTSEYFNLQSPLLSVGQKGRVFVRWKVQLAGGGIRNTTVFAMTRDGGERWTPPRWLNQALQAQDIATTGGITTNGSGTWLYFGSMVNNGGPTGDDRDIFVSTYAFP